VQSSSLYQRMGDAQMIQTLVFTDLASVGGATPKSVSSTPDLTSLGRKQVFWRMIRNPHLLHGKDRLPGHSVHTC
jgi:hypothetical protein